MRHAGCRAMATVGPEVHLRGPALSTIAIAAAKWLAIPWGRSITSVKRKTESRPAPDRRSRDLGTRGPVVSARAATYVALLISLLLALMVIFAAVILATRTQIAASRDAASARNVERVLRTLQGELEYMRPRVRDWSRWDDTYAFVESHDQAYIDSNLAPEALAKNEMDVLIITNSQGEVVWGYASSALASEAGTPPEVLVSELRSVRPARGTSATDGAGGVVDVGGVPVLVYTLPITRTTGGGPDRGTLMMGRALLPATLARLSSLADASFSLHEPKDPRLPDGLLESSASTVSDRRSTPDIGWPLTLPGYGVIVGMDGTPLLVLSSLEPESGLAGTSQGIAILMGVLLVVGVAWGGAALALVERTSLSRMTWLRDAVAGIAAGTRETAHIDLEDSPVHDDVWAVAAEVNSMLDALEESKRTYEANQAFFAKASHELRTPLNSVIGFSTLMSSGMVGPLLPEQQRQVDMILASGTRLLALTNDLLDIEKLNAGVELDIAECDINALVEGCVDAVMPLAEEKGLDVRLDLGHAPSVQADHRRMEQLLLNLLGNAIKFTDHGSVSVRTSASKDWAEIEVTDTGRGIPAAILPTVFDEFVSSVEIGKPSGTGLGLTITRQIAHRHGGDITATSTEGVGSSFVFRLPVRPPSGETARTEPVDPL
jgi:signal transduction histidine kinase